MSSQYPELKGFYHLRETIGSGKIERKNLYKFNFKICKIFISVSYYLKSVYTLQLGY